MRTTSHTTCLLATLAACAANGFTASDVAASLTIDLRLPDPPHGSGPKGGISWQNPVVQSLTIDIYAVVHGPVSDPAVYGFGSVNGSIYSLGPWRGDLEPWGDMEGFGIPASRKRTTSLAPFNAQSSQAGARRDLDGDGDLDLGAPPGGQNQNNGVEGFIVALAAPMAFVDSPAASPTLAGGLEFLIGRVRFTLTHTDYDDDDDHREPDLIIQFVPRQDTNGQIHPNAGLWYEVDGKRSPATANLTVGSPIVINRRIPEPSTIALLGLGMAGLLARRGTHHRSPFSQ